ncbi:MAG: hypothetical protein AAGG38_07620 [Planctomycetota bacterium]
MKFGHLPRKMLAGLSVLVLGLGLGFVATPSASAQEASPEQKAEFNRMVRERNQLHRELEGLDAKAARMVKEEKDPIEVNAQQVSTQDQLDLVQLRLEILSMRYGLRLPPVPGTGGSEEETVDGKTKERVMAEKAFSRGRDRALALIREESEQFAASLDFKAFLADVE